MTRIESSGIYDRPQPPIRTSFDELSASIREELLADNSKDACLAQEKSLDMAKDILAEYDEEEQIAGLKEFVADEKIEKKLRVLVPRVLLQAYRELEVEQNEQDDREHEQAEMRKMWRLNSRPTNSRPINPSHYSENDWKPNKG